MATIRYSAQDLIRSRELVKETAKVLPIILLLDISGSMAGSKLAALRAAVTDMMATLADAAYVRVTVVTFGGVVSVPIKSLSPSQVRAFEPAAFGDTPMGRAISEAKTIVEDPNAMLSTDYRPIVVLVSDGQPTDAWEGPLVSFVSTGRSQKCDRLAIPIGADCDQSVLLKFVGGDPAALVPALNVQDIPKAFRLVTMSVTSRTRSVTPNIKMTLPSAGGVTSTAPVASSATVGPLASVAGTLGGRRSESETVTRPGRMEPAIARSPEVAESDDDDGNGLW
jgi:uncharacterized protein YegL